MNTCRKTKSYNISSRALSSCWTNENIIKSPYKDVVIPNVTLHDYVWENLDRWPERTAAVSNVYNLRLNNVLWICGL